MIDVLDIVFITYFVIAGASSANRKFIKVEFSDGVTKIDKVTFVDENGETLIDNVGFTVNTSKTEDLTDDVENIETDTDNEVNIDTEEIPHEPFYIRVNGKDTNGVIFSHLFLLVNMTCHLQETNLLGCHTSMQITQFTLYRL